MSYRPPVGYSCHEPVMFGHVCSNVSHADLTRILILSRAIVLDQCCRLRVCMRREDDGSVRDLNGSAQSEQTPTPTCSNTYNTAQLGVTISDVGVSFHGRDTCLVLVKYDVSL